MSPARGAGCFRASWMLCILALLAGCAPGPTPPAPTTLPSIQAAATPAAITTRLTATPAALTTTTLTVTASPIVLPSASTTPGASPAAPIIHLLFTGDINPGRCPAQIALAHNDFTLPYQVVGEALRAADITIGSLDGALSDYSPPSPCPETMNLVGPARTVEGLQYAGFDVLTVAANHAKDCGLQGWNCSDQTFRDTLANLRGAGIQPAGGGDNLAAALQPVILERQGVRFAFLGLTEVGPNTFAAADRPGTAPLSDQSLPAVLAAIGAARQAAEVVVVLPHWGVEYAEAPSANQRRWAGDMVAAGATLVIGNHPHVVQAVEEFPQGGHAAPRAVVAYALGNFVFDQGPWRNRQGVLFEATFTGPALTSWQLRPIHIVSLYEPIWPDAAESESILSRVAAASAALPPR